MKYNPETNLKQIINICSSNKLIDLAVSYDNYNIATIADDKVIRKWDTKEN